MLRWMLSIGKIAVGQHRYYEQQVAQGSDDYYSGRGEAQGEWVGAGARALGLSGVVGSAQFNALIAGSHPDLSGVRLRAGERDPKIAAIDLTFSAPKSISVLFAVAPVEVSAALIACHEEAVRAALGYLEETSVMVRRGHAGAQVEPGGGFVAAAYRHRMSRALDPQLHTHVVAANLTRGPDGRYTALHAAPLYRAAKTAGYLYQSHLRSAVRERLGLEWGEVRKGAAELKELPVDVLRTFSQRRAQVEAAIAAKELEVGRPLTRAERSTWGAIATRDRKQYGIETHTWIEEITARASEHGLDRDLIGQITERGVERLERGELAGDGELELAGGPVGEAELGGLLAGPVGLTERANTFDEASVLRAFAAASPQGARFETVQLLAGRFAAREDVLVTDRGNLTTRDLVDTEQVLIDVAIQRAGERTAQVVLATVARSLTVDQTAAVRAVAGSGNGVDVIEALAGTGKTYTAGALREVYEASGYTVVGVAPTGRAVRELSEKAGIRARTLDSQLLSIDGGWVLPERCVVIFDEAAMASTRQSARLLEHAAERGAKVIAIGDPGQLPSVQAGGWMRAIGERIGAVRLTEVMRQRDPAERRALAALHDGIPQRWLGWAREIGRVEVLADGEALERAVREWAAGVGEHGVGRVVMIARENETRRALNDLAREHQRDTGLLGAEGTYGPVTVAVGDRVVCRRNDRDLDVDNGMRGTVRHLDRDRVVIETDAHLTRELPAGYVAEHVEHAYALTGHGMQGGTVEQAIVIAAPHELTAGWSYTALSRARGQTRLLVTTHQPAELEREEIAPATPSAQRDASEVLTRVARRMLERDDEDLAIDQLPAPGHADDPELARAPRGEPLQEHAAERAEPAQDDAPQPSLAELRIRLEQLRAQLAGLPTGELDQIDELDRRAIALTEQRDQLRDALARLPEPRTRRLGRSEDPHMLDRTRMTSMRAGVEEHLGRTLSQRATLARELGDVDPVREERDGLSNAFQQIQSEHDQVLTNRVERELAARPQWALDTLGERPQRGYDAERWDRAARQLARYRIEYDITDTREPLGPEPDGREQRHEYDRAVRARDQLARELGREPDGLDLGRG
jgi:conjugative relaxase-like TrwC/TraI family protein